MNCISCNNNCVKNGLDRKGNQRFKCQECKKTFTKETKQKLHILKDKRVVLHLILAGCKSEEIAENLGIPANTITKWGKFHLRGLPEILPSKSLLWIETLIRIYRGIEKSKISTLIYKRRNKQS